MIEDIVFRGVEFSVKIEVIKGVLMVEISELLTADQWRGEFDPACEYYTPIVCSVSLKIQLERVSSENLFPHRCRRPHPQNWQLQAIPYFL